MAIAPDSASSGFAVGDTSVETDHTTGTLTNGMMLIKVYADGNDNTIGTPTVGGSATGVTLLHSRLFGNPGDNLGRVSWYYKVAPSSGTVTVAAAFGSAANGVILVETFSGWAQTSSFGTPDDELTDFGGTDQPSLALSTTSGNFVSDFVAWNTALEARTAVAGAGQTRTALDFTVVGAAASYETASGASTTMSWTLTETDETTPSPHFWVQIAAVGNAAAAGSTPTPPVATLALTSLAPRMDLGIRPPTLLRG